MTKKTRFNGKQVSIAIVLAMFLTFSALPCSAQSNTVATFSNPSASSADPLFTIGGGVINGGWGDSQTDLDLEIILTGNVYPDAFFVIPTPITYAGDMYSGAMTGAGSIDFYADNAVVGTDAPILTVEFQSSLLNVQAVGATSFFITDNVQITGTALGSVVLSDEVFSFAFANQQAINGDWGNGFTATAAFDSSAVPEPAGLALLALGSLLLKRRNKK